MPTWYTPYLPPKYYARFKERLYRLFGSKVPEGYREELLERVKHRHGIIRSNRTRAAFARILKECYADSIEDLISPNCKLLDAIRK